MQFQKLLAVFAFLVSSTALSSDFDINFSYRDISANPLNRVVQIQGDHINPNKKIEPICGATGENCTCFFYQSEMDKSPVRASAVFLSHVSNVLSCTIPGPVAANNYTFVKVRTNNAMKKSELIPILTSLSAEQVLQGLDKDAVRKVFSYSCARNFIEGSGVDDSSISCALTPDLGFLRANYEFYVYSGSVKMEDPEGNLADRPMSSILYPAYCNRAGDAQYTCGAQSEQPIFGLMRNPVGYFQTSVFLTSKPEGSMANSFFGFAALSDADGLCPPGLMAVRAFRADPPSITKGMLGENPSSTFLNSNGSLNSILVREANISPENFTVYRNPNKTPCDVMNNDCSVAEFAGFTPAVSVPYSPQYPTICTLPPSLLTAF